MKISIATGPWLPVPPVQGGSVPRMWQGLAEEFASAGHHVTLLSRSYPGQPSSEVHNGVTYNRRGGLSQGRVIAVDLIKDLAYAIGIVPTLPRADILIINDFWLPFLAQWVRPKSGKIIINANRFPKGQYFLYGGATRIAAASQAIREAIVRQQPSAASRTRVYPNPIDTDVFSPPSVPREVKSAQSILYAGRVHPEKGLHLLIDAFAILAKQLPEARLKVLGPVKASQGGGGIDYIQMLQAKAQGLNVEFLEPIFEIHRLAAVYRDADLFCYPSLAEKGESFGVAPLEAMATGLVPVVSSLDCFRDFIQEGETGYYFDHRGSSAANLLALALASAMSNKEKTAAMGVRASAKAKDYSFKHIAKRYLEDFQELIAN